MEPHADPLSAQSGHPVYRHRKVLTTWPAPRSWQRKGGTQDGWAYDPRLAAKTALLGKESGRGTSSTPHLNILCQERPERAKARARRKPWEALTSRRSAHQQNRGVSSKPEPHHTASFNQSEPPPLLLCSARVLEGSCNQRSVSSFTFFLCCCDFSTDSSLCGAWRGRGGGGSHSTPLIFSSFTSPWFPFVFSLPCPWRSLGALVQRCLSNVTDVQERLSLCPSLGGCDRAQRTEQNAALAKSRMCVSGFAEWEPGWLAPVFRKRTTGQGVCLISTGPF